MAIHGFELLQEQTVAETNSTARFYRHARTGAELLSLANTDENKVFGVAFRAPPHDSTGEVASRKVQSVRFEISY